jgi:hypothetical protein
MRNPSKYLLSLLLFAAICVAAPKSHGELEVKGEGVTRVTLVKTTPFTLTAPEGHDLYFWTVPDGVTAKEVLNVLNVTKIAKKGNYTFKVLCYTKTIDFDKKTSKVVKENLEATVAVGEIAPGPTPKPDPDDPDPPVPAGAMRVLIVYESADLPKLPKEQRLLVNDLPFQGVLKDRCDKAGPGGMGWAIWDKDQDTSKADKFWQDALKHPKPSLPYIQIYKADKLVKEQALPATKKEILDLINQYAGE